MLTIISSVTCIGFIIIDIHTIVSLDIVSRIYGRLFLYLMNSKSDATYTRTYLLPRKQCLMFMLLLAASEHAEKNLGRAPTNFHVAERQSFVE